MSININSPKKSKLKLNKALHLGNYTPNDLFRRYITIDEMKNHPEINPAIRGDKKIRLDVLSRQKQGIINIKGVQNQNKINFVSKLNSFHKIFFNSFKNNNYSKNELYNLNNENKEFLKKYKNSNKNNSENKFNEIKLEYEKKNYFLSPFEGNKNLFNGNILLSNKEELKNYILYDLGTSQSNNKSLSFLHKINKNLGDKTSEKELKKLNLNLDLINLGKDKIKNDKKKEIEKTQNDIVNTKETINSIDEFNYFFDKDNKNYLNFLKNGNSRGSSAKISTRVNSALNYFENVKCQYNNEIMKKEKDLENKVIKTKNKGRNIRNLDEIRNLITENNENPIGKKKYSKIYIKTDDNDSSKSPLEKLYDKISTKDNILNYQQDIKTYLKNKKYDLSSKINPINICKNFEKTKEKLCQSEFLKQDMQLRKQIGGNISHAEKIINNNLKKKEKINNIEDTIIKIYCNINNPRKKEE